MSYFDQESAWAELGIQNGVYWSAERRLLLAVLKRAIYDFVSDNEQESEIAGEWIFDDADAEIAFSLPWICNQLDLDYLKTIKAIGEMPRQAKLLLSRN